MTLRSAFEHFLAGRRDDAARELEAALPSATQDTLVAAGLLAFGLDRFQLMTECLRRSGSPRALEHLTTFAGRLGWEHEALDAGRKLRAARPSPLLDAREFNRLTRQGDGASAIPLGQRLLANERGERAAAVRIELCHAHAQVLDVEGLRAELKKASAPTRLEEALELISLHVEADQCDAASALADQSATRWPERAEPHLWRSRFARWTGDSTSAEHHAREAIALDAESADAWAALGDFTKALELDPHHCEAWTLKADQLERDGDASGMASALNTAISTARRFPAMAWILRALGALPDGLEVSAISEARIQEGIDALEELVPGSRDALRNTPSVKRTRECLASARAAVSGNFTEQTTRLTNGRLTRLGPAARQGPRAASRTVLELIRCRPIEDVLARFDEVVRAFPRSSLPLCHRAELLLWVGRLDEAERDFQSAISLVRGTRFAWIGLTGIASLRGKHEEALALCAEGVHVMGDTSGPAVFAYRGEALRQLGRLDEARVDFEEGLRHSPRRLSSVINLALVHFAAGRIDEGTTLALQIFDRAPALIADARREANSTDWSRVLEQSLTSMRGNRSTSLILYWSGNQLRLVPNAPGSSVRIHEHTRRECELALRAL